MPMNSMWLFLLFLAAPSLWLIRFIKSRFDKETRTVVQRGWSLFFAAWALERDPSDVNRLGLA